MKRRFGLLAVIAMVASLALPATALAGDDESPIYLSLGTSLAAGTMVDDSGAGIPFTGDSYTDQIYDRLNKKTKDLQHVKLGCPGETTVTMQFGGICDAGGPLEIYPDSQLDEALAVAASGNVALITIDIGANDLLQALPDVLACGDDFDCANAIVSGIAADAAGIVGVLQAAAPDATIVVSNYNNVNVAAWIGYYGGVPAGAGSADPAFAMLSDGLVQLFNGTLAAILGGMGITMADTYGYFSSGDLDDDNDDGVPNAVDRVCKLTFMCPDDGIVSDIHPNAKGYQAMARAFFSAFKDLRKSAPK